MNIVGTEALPQDMARFVEAAVAIVNRVDARLKRAAEVTLAEYSVLWIIECETQPRMVDIAAKLKCNRSNMTQLIDRMQRRGLVKRIIDPKNSRGFLVTFTAEGKNRYWKANREYGEAVRSAREEAAAHGYTDL
jgi:DNA-binding MarR family transcriptional regulator